MKDLKYEHQSRWVVVRLEGGWLEGSWGGWWWGGCRVHGVGGCGGGVHGGVDGWRFMGWVHILTHP